METRLTSRILTVATLSLCACAPTGFSANPTTTSNKVDADPPVARAASCTPVVSDYDLNVTVFSFGLSGDAVKAGYNGPIAGPVTKLGVGFDVSSGTLALQADYQSPGDSGPSSLQTVNVSSPSGWGFSVDVGIANIGYSTTSDAAKAMLGLTQLSVDKLLKNAGKTLGADLRPWQTRVTEVLTPKLIRVPVGSFAGIQPGDEFAIYKYHGSDMDNSGACIENGYTDEAPFAVITPTSNGIHGDTTVMVIAGAAQAEILINDVVMIRKLATTGKSQRASLKKSIRFILHEPNHLVLDNAAMIDISSYLNYEIKGSLYKTGFWARP